MGAVADAVLAMKGEVIGVIPRSGWVTAKRRPDGSNLKKNLEQKVSHLFFLA